jgi:arylsulfatase A-like enzyme
MRVKNVILIVSDTLRRDFLGCYGNRWVRTPNISKFAEISVVFDRAYIHNFPTVPARADIYTGRYTSAYFDWQPLPPNETVLAEVLSGAGITTFLVGDTYNLFRDGYYFDRGFTGFEWVRGNGGDRWQTRPKEPLLPADPEKLFDIERYLKKYLRNASVRLREDDYPCARTMRLAAEWLEANYREGPFFLHVDTFDPHEPWDPPRWYVDLYDPGYEGDEVIAPRYAPIDFLTPAELNHCRALYAAEITLVDTWLGYLFAKIENLGLLENTAVIFTSDHGFYFGEHGWIGKSFIGKEVQHFLPLYEEVAHVPLLVYLPGLKPGRCGALVQPVDIAPTVYQLLGVEMPPTVQGRSWVPLLTGELPQIREFAWSGPAVHHPGRWRPSTITTEEWSLIFNGPVAQPEPHWSVWAVDGNPRREVIPTAETVPNLDLRPKLYHLPSDPGQQRDLFEDYPEVARELHRKYLAMLEELGLPENVIRMRSVL